MTLQRDMLTSLEGLFVWNSDKEGTLRAGAFRHFHCKYHEMKMLLPVTSTKKWLESAMHTVNMNQVYYAVCNDLSFYF